MTTPEDFLQSLQIPMSDGEKLSIQVGDLTREIIDAQLTGKMSIEAILRQKDSQDIIQVFGQIQNTIRNVQLVLRNTQLELDTEGNKTKYDEHDTPQLDTETTQKLEVL
jgi:hypothetical protein